MVSDLQWGEILLLGSRVGPALASCQWGRAKGNIAVH